jgi:hypothetical protein
MDAEGAGARGHDGVFALQDFALFLATLFRVHGVRLESADTIPLLIEGHM